MEEKTSKKKNSVAMEVVSLVLILILCIITVSSATSGHRYSAGDPVPLYVNKIGPFANSMYTLNPCFFCFPEKKTAPLCISNCFLLSEISQGKLQILWSSFLFFRFVFWPLILSLFCHSSLLCLNFMAELASEEKETLVHAPYKFWVPCWFWIQTIMQEETEKRGSCQV